MQARRHAVWKRNVVSGVGNCLAVRKILNKSVAVLYVKALGRICVVRRIRRLFFLFGAGVVAQVKVSPYCIGFDFVSVKSSRNFDGSVSAAGNFGKFWVVFVKHIAAKLVHRAVVGVDAHRKRRIQKRHRSLIFRKVGIIQIVCAYGALVVIAV